MKLPQEAAVSLVHFPKPEAQILLLDIDNTVATNHSTINDPLIYRTIQKAQAKGWKIGLNSSKSLQAQRFWRYCLALNGPIIAEKGAFVDWKGAVHCSPETAAMAALFKQARLRAEASLASPDTLVWHDSDPVRSLALQHYNNRKRKPGDVVTIFNPYRQLGLSAFVRTVDVEGDFIQDEAVTADIAMRLADFIPQRPYVESIEHHDVGLVGASYTALSKRDGVLALRNLENLGDKRVGMIGNGNDFMGRDIALHYAVSNADEEFIRDYTADSPQAAGVVEIISRLADISIEYA